MQIYHKLKLQLGLILLLTQTIEMLDIWYYNSNLNKECIITLAKKSDIDRYLPPLTAAVKKNKCKLTYIHFIKTLNINTKF